MSLNLSLRSSDKLPRMSVRTQGGPYREPRLSPYRRTQPAPLKGVGLPEVVTSTHKGGRAEFFFFIKISENFPKIFPKKFLKFFQKNFCEISGNFWEISEKFLRNFWEISENFPKNFQKFPEFSENFPEKLTFQFQKLRSWKVNFQKNFRKFLRNFRKFFRNF